MKLETITLADALTLRSAMVDLAVQYKNAGFDLEESLALIEGVLFGSGNQMVLPFAKLQSIRHYDKTTKVSRSRFWKRKNNVNA